MHKAFFLVSRPVCVSAASVLLILVCRPLVFMVTDLGFDSLFPSDGNF